VKPAFLLSSAAALALFAQPAAAQEAPADGTVAEADFSNLDEDEVMDQLRAEIDAEFGVLAELFKVEPLTPEREARLPQAQEMTDLIFPVGTFGAMMKDAMDPMMGMVMTGVASDPRIRLSAVSGVGSDELADLSDEDAQEALDIFDPGFASRTSKLGDVTVEMIGRLFDAIEPTYRDALARAMTGRFDDAELAEALTLMQNPLVAKLAQQSFVVQYDPQMMAVMEQLGPALIEVMPGMMEEFADLEAELADEGRNFTELSRAERQRAARLLGKSENELDALAPEAEQAEEETEDGVI
jgi:hypothetical protein